MLSVILLYVLMTLLSIPKWTRLLLYIHNLHDDAIHNTVVCADDNTFYSECDKTSALWQQLQLAFELQSGGSLISLQEKLSFFDLTGRITLVLLMEKWVCLFLKKIFFLRFESIFLF